MQSLASTCRFDGTKIGTKALEQQVRASESKMIFYTLEHHLCIDYMTLASLITDSLGNTVVKYSPP